MLWPTPFAGKDDKRSTRRTGTRPSAGIAPVFNDMPYFMNEEFTLVDCCLAPILWRLEFLEVKLPGPGSRQVRPLISYMQRVFERPSFRLSLSQREREMR